MFLCMSPLVTVILDVSISQTDKIKGSLSYVMLYLLMTCTGWAQKQFRQYSFMAVQVLVFDWIAGSSQVITLGEKERGACKGKFSA